MKLSADEKLCLENLYTHFAVPTDQLRRVPTVLGRITGAFCRLTGRNEESGEVLRYMINRRKNKDWPTLGTAAKKFEPAAHAFEEGESEILKEIYLKLDIPSDEFLFKPDHGRAIAQEFARRVGRIVPAPTVVAAIMQKRKRGEWPCIREEILGGEFADIKEVAKKHRKQA